MPGRDRRGEGGSGGRGSGCCAVVGDGGCEAYTVIGWGGGLSHERKNVAEAETLGSNLTEALSAEEALARRAVALDGDDAEARSRLAIALQSRGDYQGGQAEAERALV